MITRSCIHTMNTIKFPTTTINVFLGTRISAHFMITDSGSYYRDLDREVCNFLARLELCLCIQYFLGWLQYVFFKISHLLCQISQFYSKFGEIQIGQKLPSLTSESYALSRIFPCILMSQFSFCSVLLILTKQSKSRTSASSSALYQ